MLTVCLAVVQQQGHGHAGEIAAAGAGAAAGGALFAASRPSHDEPQRATAQGHPIQVIYSSWSPILSALVIIGRPLIGRSTLNIIL